jgi:hypothetical protein
MPRQAAGEMVLCDDRSSKRFYDFQEAVKIARRDGWGFPGMTEEARATMKRGEIAQRAAMADFERLRAWCNDQWHYVGCVVTLLDEDDEETDEAESLWGIESDADEYLQETALELADEILSRVVPAEIVARDDAMAEMRA